MNEMMKIAGEYFNRFEGRHLYPKWRSYHWLLLALASIAFIATGWHGAATLFANRGLKSNGISLVLVLLCEFAVIGSIHHISEYRQKKLAGPQAKTRSEVNAKINVLRVAALKDLTQSPPTKFLMLVKDCQELVKLKKELRTSEEQGVADFRERLYASDSKARILSLVLLLLTASLTLLVRSLPPDFDFVEVMLDGGFLTLVATMLVVSALFFIMLTGMTMLLRVVLQGGHMWMAKLLGLNQSQLALKYFLRDLVRFHRFTDAQSEPVARISHEPSNEGSFDASDSPEKVERSGT